MRHPLVPKTRAFLAIAAPSGASSSFPRNGAAALEPAPNSASANHATATAFPRSPSPSTRKNPLGHDAGHPRYYPRPSVRHPNDDAVFPASIRGALFAAASLEVLIAIWRRPSTKRLPLLTPSAMTPRHPLLPPRRRNRECSCYRRASERRCCWRFRGKKRRRRGRYDAREAERKDERNARGTAEKLTKAETGGGKRG